MTTKRKVRADFDKSQPISVNVSGRSKDVKKQVIQAFLDVGLFWSMGCRDLSPAGVHVNSYTNLFDEASGDKEAKGCVMWSITAKGITPAEFFFSMVYEDEPQGHPHAELMMAYAEDAKTHAEPWKLWEVRNWQPKPDESSWIDCKFMPEWDVYCEYRRKPKTHLVHGVEVPDLRIKPSRGENYYYPLPTSPNLVRQTIFIHGDDGDKYILRNNLCYEYTEAGKQAAILHAKIMLGIAGE